nr:hypothetical protein [Tanacetum cinerariifolium]
INKSSAEYTEDNSNDEDNEDSNSAKEEQNNKDFDSVNTPPVKKHGRPKKIVKDNENKTSSVKRRGRPRKNNDESKKQTIVQKEKQKCLYEIGFGSLIGMAIYELPGMLESLESRSADDPFIKEWFSQLGDKNEVRPNDITDDYIKMIKEKCYNIHQDLISVREKLDEGLSRFPDSKKLNMFREKFEETTTGIDNDDTTGIDKESHSPDFQMESDSPASDDDNQKSNFQVLFHKESGNSYLQRMKNKDRNEDVDHILNEDDKVDDSCPAAGFCSVIEGDEVILSEVEEVEKEKKQIGNEDDRVVEDSHTTIPDSVTEGKE